MLKLRMLQILYFLASFVDMVIGGLGFLFLKIAEPFDNMADKLLVKTLEMNNKLEEEEKQNQ